MVWIAEAILPVFFDLPQLHQLISFLGVEKEVAIILSICMHRALHCHERPRLTPISLASTLAVSIPANYTQSPKMSALGQKQTLACAPHLAPD